MLLVVLLPRVAVAVAILAAGETRFAGVTCRRHHPVHTPDTLHAAHLYASLPSLRPVLLSSRRPDHPRPPPPPPPPSLLALSPTLSPSRSLPFPSPSFFLKRARQRKHRPRLLRFFRIIRLSRVSLRDFHSFLSPAPAPPAPRRPGPPSRHHAERTVSLSLSVDPPASTRLLACFFLPFPRLPPAPRPLSVPRASSPPLSSSCCSSRATVPFLHAPLPLPSALFPLSRPQHQRVESPLPTFAG